LHDPRISATITEKRDFRHDANSTVSLKTKA
jgi:hypothetical protein